MPRRVHFANCKALSCGIAIPYSAPTQRAYVLQTGKCHICAVTLRTQCLKRGRRRKRSRHSHVSCLGPNHLFTPPPPSSYSSSSSRPSSQFSAGGLNSFSPERERGESRRTKGNGKKRWGSKSSPRKCSLPPFSDLLLLLPQELICISRFERRRLFNPPSSSSLLHFFLHHSLSLSHSVPGGKEK